MTLRKPLGDILRGLASVALTLACLGAAADAQAPAGNAARPGRVDLEKSRVYAFVAKKGAGHDHAVEGRLSGGEIKLGSTRAAGSLTFDMNSFKADTAEARKYVGLEGEVSAKDAAAVTKTMLDKEVLDAANHTTAKFNVRSALMKRDASGKPFYDLAGDFTMHGRTHPITINCEATMDGKLIRLRGSFFILQSEFDIKPYSKLFFFGVTDRLDIYGDIYLSGYAGLPPAQ